MRSNNSVPQAEVRSMTQKNSQDRLANSPGPMDVTDRYVSEFVAGEILGVKIKTLRRWRLLGRPPRFRHFGALVRYSVADLHCFAHESIATARRPGGAEFSCE